MTDYHRAARAIGVVLLLCCATFVLATACIYIADQVMP